VRSLTTAARAGQIDFEQVFQLVELVSVASTTSHGDWGTIHVELWLARELRDPVPG